MMGNMQPTRRPTSSADASSSARAAPANVAAMRSPWVVARSVPSGAFLYQKMIRESEPSARPGDLVHVYDRRGELFGCGLFNPRSQIVVRILARGSTPVDDEFWRAALQRAIALRRAQRIDETTDAYRLVHAEGDALSGLIVERYADTLVFEMFSLGMFQRRQMLTDLLAELLGAPAQLERPDRASPTWRTVVRADARIQKLEGFRASSPKSDTPLRTTIREHGVRYRVDLATGHKTGFFCDQRDNRRRFAALCDGADVLDVCCYSGGFGLCAKLLGSAREVTSVDLDEDAVALARENANLNQTRIQLVHADAFAYLRQMGANQRRYDAIVLDPPKLAQSRRDLDEAGVKYFDLNRLALRLVRPGGLLLTCSCSGSLPLHRFTEIVHAAASRTGRRVQMFDRTGAGADHPIMLDCPESEYLKALWLRVL